jgi:molybdate transport system ATP-binding protein
MLSLDVRLERSGFTLSAALELAAPVTGLFGPSGAGKSTLLQIIAGLVPPQAGRVALDGAVLCDTAAGVAVPTHRRRVALVFQDGRLLPHHSVEGNLRYGERHAPAAERRLGFAEVVELLELAPLLARPVQRLSGGECRRVALGRALLCSPRLLLLDEPLAGLDERLKRQILPFLRRVRDHAGIPMIYVSHDLGEILELTDRLVLIAGGRIAASGGLLDLARLPAALPLLHDLGLVNVLAGTVVALEGEVAVVRCGPADGAHALLRVARGGLAAGAAVTVTIPPDGIALATAPVPGLSMANQLPGVVESLTGGAGRLLAVVDAGVRLVVAVDAAAGMGLAPGSRVHCLFRASVV